jgi:anti-sigma regulatory factor (Ser/Thr protein kinase)
MSEIFRFNIPSEMKYLERVYDLVSGVLESLPTTDNIRDRLILAVNEAVTNGLTHGNRNDPSKTIALVFKMDERCVEIEVEDEGKGFVPQHSKLEDSAKSLHTSGRGIPIMKVCTDEVQFQRILPQGMRVRLIKKICP